MIFRIFVAFIVALAVIVGILFVAIPHDHPVFMHLVMFHDFFSVTLPILGFAALLKFLCSCGSCKCECCGDKSCDVRGDVHNDMRSPRM